MSSHNVLLLNHEDLRAESLVCETAGQLALQTTATGDITPPAGYGSVPGLLAPVSKYKKGWGSLIVLGGREDEGARFHEPSYDRGNATLVQ